MPCPHNEITIVQRSQRQSAVAAAAYQSGEKLFCEYDQQVKHYPEKRGIVHNEILLPPNAPQEYADRNTLWNAAEAVEKQWNSQLARRWVLTIPREIPPDQYAVLVREFCQKQFVSKGMIADFAILFRIQEAEERRLRLYEDYKAEILDEDEYSQLKEHYIAEKQRLEHELQKQRQRALELEKRIKICDAQMERMRGILNQNEFDEELVHELIKRIYVGMDNSVEVEFKCSDPYQEVLAIMSEVQNE